MAEENKSNNLDIFSSLTEEEKEKINQILEDVSTNGKSDNLEELYYSDYEEIPVDIKTFLSSEQYLGNFTNMGKDIYPTWMKELEYVHNPMNFVDQWAITGSTGTGKAQPLDALVFTPSGYVKMRDLKIGDTVVCGNGKQTIVTHIFKRGMQPTYRVTFSDRTSVLCAKDHLWKVGSRKHRNNVSRIVYENLTTEQIMQNGLRKKDNRLVYRIPTPVLDCWNENKELEINPYIMGVLLGDGCFHNGAVSVSLFESDIYEKVNDILNKEGYKLNMIGDRYGQYRITRNNQDNNSEGYGQKLNRFGLMNKKSIEKFIPKEYLYTTVENRIELLHGLFDTDGYTSTRGKRSQLIFNTSSPQLSEDFAFLVRSLGGTDTIVESKAGYKKDGIYHECHNTFEHTIKFSNDVLPFSSKKHTEKYVAPENKAMRRIGNIEYVGEQECQCIVVEDDDHTYITDNLTVTHNSSCGVYSVAYELYKLLCLKNPNRFYLEADETIWILFFGLSLRIG